MDAFYVAVELLRRPELVGKPVVVGAPGRRGVVAAASYEARAYGVRSALPSLRARQLRPEAVFLPGDHAEYARVSKRVMAIFARFTPLVEPLSLDEAFLDVTGAQRRAGSPAAIGAEVRRLVAHEEGLTCSVGVAPTKFLAKLASEAAKPAASPSGPVPGIGVMVVPPGAELAFLHPLPLRALWGVGPKTLERLTRLGIDTVGGLAGLPVEAIVAAVGDAAGRHLWELAQGRDPREIEPDRALKSVGHEETFPVDLVDVDACQRELVRLADAVAGRLRGHGIAGRTVTLKVRYGDFRTLTRSHTARDPLDSGPALAREARALLDTLDVRPGIRLLGVSVSGLTSEASRQLSFDDLAAASPAAPSAAAPAGPVRAAAADWEEAERAIDAIRGRFGAAAIGPGTLASPNGVRVLRGGAKPWGPDEEASVPSKEGSGRA